MRRGKMPRLLSAQPDGTEGIMLTITNFSKTYAGGKKAVDNLSLTVNAGEIMGFIGHNGAGKTTTIKMLSCLTKPTGGDALVGGYSITKEPEQVKRLIGVSPQETAVAPNLSVKENLELICGIHSFSKGKTEEKIRELSGQFALDTVLKRKLILSLLHTGMLI